MARIPISASVKRLVRQRAGMGCVMCGCPVYDYEHIEGYAKTGNDPDQLTLLCAMHHREKTVGRLPVDVVRKAAAAPHNLRLSNGPKHPLFFDSELLMVAFGNVRSVATSGRGEHLSGIVVDGNQVVGASREGGRVQLSVDLRDIDNVPMLRIYGGEIRLMNRAWDITFVGKTLTVYSGPGSVAIEMVLNPPDRLEITSGNFYNGHVHFLIGAQTASGGVEIPSADIALSGFDVDGAVALSIGRAPSPSTSLFGVEQVPRSYGAEPAPFGAFKRDQR